MSIDNWIVTANTSISEVSANLALNGSRGHYPCPNHCDKDRPVYSTGPKWQCMRCGIRGDSVDFVSFALAGKRYRDLGTEERAAVRAWFGMATERRATAPAAPAEPVAASVSPDALGAFWGRCRPVPPRHGFLLSRAIDPVLVARLDLARLTPATASRHGKDAWPVWWPTGRSRCWRLIARGYDTSGEVVNLHGRAVIDPPFVTDDSGESKQLSKAYWAKGIPSSGCLLWNRVQPESACLVIICEGITDWLSMAAVEYQSPVCVFGGTSGGFGVLSRWPIPMATQILSAVDSDATGDKYNHAIANALPHHSIHRMPLPSGSDVNDAVMAGRTVRELIGEAMAG